MNKKILIFSASIILLAAACSKQPAPQPAAPAPTPMAAQNSGQSSLKSLMMAGVPQKCDVSNSTAAAQSQGTIYVASGKMRGDFTITSSSGKNMTTHMINDGTTIYTWADGIAMAMKMSASATKNAAASSGSQSSASQSIDTNAQYHFSCSPWNEDSSLYSPPTNINFVDESSMMMQGQSSSSGGSSSAGASMSGSASSNAAACSACNNAGAGKAQCLAALHC